MAGATKLAPLTGAVSKMAGGRFAAGCTTIVTVDDARPPSASYATAVSAYVPAGTEDQAIVYGAAVRVPMRFVPEKNSTRSRRFSGSHAEAITQMFAGAVKVKTVPFAGAGRLTSGG